MTDSGECNPSILPKPTCDPCHISCVFMPDTVHVEDSLKWSATWGRDMFDQDEDRSWCQSNTQMLDRETPAEVDNLRLCLVQFSPVNVVWCRHTSHFFTREIINMRHLLKLIHSSRKSYFQMTVHNGRWSDTTSTFVCPQFTIMNLRVHLWIINFIE